jgi:uncharacterized protein YgiM (DUF1202 family)
MSLSGLAKFITGFILALAILFFAGASTARYLIGRLTAPPPRPVFPNDLPDEATTASSTDISESSGNPSDNPSGNPEAEARTTEEMAVEEPVPSPSPALPGDAYRARVTQPIGLIVRQGPGVDTEQVGGVDYNQEVIVLSSSDDGEWLRVRLAGSGMEGWVKSGNTERVEPTE